MALTVVPSARVFNGNGNKQCNNFNNNNNDNNDNHDPNNLSEKNTWCLF